jgi:hypothetical protein
MPFTSPALSSIRALSPVIAIAASRDVKVAVAVARER